MHEAKNSKKSHKIISNNMQLSTADDCEYRFKFFQNNLRNSKFPIRSQHKKHLKKYYSWEFPQN